MAIIGNPRERHPPIEIRPLKPYEGTVVNNSGQITATSHDLTQNGGLVREIPLFQGNLAW